MAADLAVIHLVIVKKGDEDLPGLTDKYIPRRLGPKRASKIRKLFVSFYNHLHSLDLLFYNNYPRDLENII